MTNTTCSDSILRLALSVVASTLLLLFAAALLAPTAGAEPRPLFSISQKSSKPPTMAVDGDQLFWIHEGRKESVIRRTGLAAFAPQDLVKFRGRPEPYDFAVRDGRVAFARTFRSRMKRGEPVYRTVISLFDPSLGTLRRIASGETAEVPGFCAKHLALVGIAQGGDVLYSAVDGIKSRGGGCRSRRDRTTLYSSSVTDAPSGQVQSEVIGRFAELPDFGGLVGSDVLFISRDTVKLLTPGAKARVLRAAPRERDVSVGAMASTGGQIMVSEYELVTRPAARTTLYASSAPDAANVALSKGSDFEFCGENILRWGSTLGPNSFASPQLVANPFAPGAKPARKFDLPKGQLVQGVACNDNWAVFATTPSADDARSTVYVEAL